MSSADTNGFITDYRILGSGPPLLMFSPGGFNAAADNWSQLGRYRDLKLVDHLSEHFSCILFDRRESGQSGGRVERLDWTAYVAQGRALLDHLAIERAHLIGGCAGCSVAVAFAATYTEKILSMVLFSPAGGVRYRMSQHSRFARHLAYVAEYGLDGVARLAANGNANFSADPRVGPWGPVLAHDDAFARRYVTLDREEYIATIQAISRLMFDRDTVPGAEPEDLMALKTPTLVIPGHDDSHATSAARYLEECLVASEYWDVAVGDQTEIAVNDRIIDFLQAQPTG